MMKHYYLKIGAWIGATSIALIPVSVFAQLSEAKKELDKVNATSSGGPTDLPTFIGKLINVLLSVLGIILVVYVVYAGYLWMTASGEKEKVEKAKKMLGQAIIGIVLIIAAWAISDFVITRLIIAATS